MEVEDGLPRVGAAGIEEVYAVGSEPVPGAKRLAPGGNHACLEVFVVDCVEVLAVPLGDDERMATVGGAYVHERDGLFVFVDDFRRHFAGDDPAEKALARVAHGAHPTGPRRSVAFRLPAVGTTTDELLEEQARATISHLASFERGSASDGEHRAARWIANRLGELGAPALVERESAHGGYWWPLGLMTAIAGTASFLRSRLAWLVSGAAMTAAVADDISGGPKLFRRLLPSRPTWNVVATAGDPTAERTVVVVAHHDAAHWSLLFSPVVPEFFGRRFPKSLEKADTTPPVMFPVFAGPLLVFLAGITGSRLLRRLGTILSLGSAAAFVEIGSRSVVPGANDNLSGVAVLTGLAQLLKDEPIAGTRVMLVSTGSEESFMEGMQAFGRRHFDRLPTGTTHFICVDTVGSPTLMELEGEGMLVMRDYPADFKDLVSRAAADEGVELVRGLRFRNATDGLISMKAGYPTVMLGSITEFKAPANYHWPTDTPDRIDYSTVVGATRVCHRAIELLSES